MEEGCEMNSGCLEWFGRKEGRKKEWGFITASYRVPSSCVVAHVCAVELKKCGRAGRNERFSFIICLKSGVEL